VFAGQRLSVNDSKVWSAFIFEKHVGKYLPVDTISSSTALKTSNLKPEVPVFQQSLLHDKVAYALVLAE
jgi:hypothetical protein